MSKKSRSNLNKAVCKIIFKDSEISKLKIKLQNNTELIQSKDQLIEQLKIELGKTSPTKQQQQH